MVKRVTKDLLDKAAMVDDDKFPISDSEDLFKPSDPESGQLKRISWGSLKEQFIQKTVTFIVTSDFALWEVIDITDWTWSITGAATRSIWDTWDITSLGSTDVIFNSNATLKVTDNKASTLKGVEVIWDSETTFHFTRELWAWEWFIIEDGTSSWGGTIWNTTVDGDLVVTGTTDLQGVTQMWEVNASWLMTAATINANEIQLANSLIRYVYTEADFPAAVSWIITLDDNICYHLMAPLVMSNRIVCGENNNISSCNELIPYLTYTGTGTFITWTDISFRCSQVGIVCPTAEAFNFSATAAQRFILMNEVFVIYATSWGTFSDIESLTINNSWSLDVWTGITLTWTTYWKLLSIDKLSIESSSPSAIWLDFTTSIHPTVKLRAVEMDMAPWAVGISGLSNSWNIVSWSIAAVKDWGFLWEMTPLSWIDASDVRWSFIDNTNLQNTQVYGEMWMPSQETVTLTEDVITIVNDTTTWGTNIWSEVEASKFEVDSSLWRMTFKWEETLFFVVSATSTVEKVGWWSEIIAWYIVKNGTPILNSSAQTQNTQPTSITCQTWVSLNKDDYIEFAVENQGSSANVIINISNLIIR